MIEKIKNNKLCVGVNLFGAELEFVKFGDVNILWQRSELWAEQSPILFPNIGSFKDSKYEYAGKIYHTLVHGFAKRSTFKVKEKTATSLCLELNSSMETLEIFPFEFSLQITYTLKDETLNCGFVVRNLSSNTMYFSIGIHPGFSYKGLNNLLGKPYLKIDPENYKSIDFDKAYVKGSHYERLALMQLSDLSKMLVIPRTLCYQNLQTIEFLGDRGVIVLKHDMPYTAFWQKVPEGSPEFICVEAWNGMPDSINEDYNLAKKTNLISLDSHSIFKTYYSITYIEN